MVITVKMMIKIEGAVISNRGNHDDKKTITSSSELDQ